MPGPGSRFSDTNTTGVRAIRRSAGRPGRGRAARSRRRRAGPLTWTRRRGFALVAGAVAASNPCGFALLPAYLGLLASDARARAAAGAVRFTGGMALGFVAVFGLVGVVLAPLVGSMTRYLPVVATR